ncbi:MAG: hypothetical protein ACLTSZ_09500 [Lachnospiraceae bacterium]
MDELRIWVGDSRTLGMEQALDGATPDVFIGAAGEGYDWFAADGLPQLLSAMKAHPLSPIIFNLGVNRLRQSLPLSCTLSIAAKRVPFCPVLFSLGQSDRP